MGFVLLFVIRLRFDLFDFVGFCVCIEDLFLQFKCLRKCAKIFITIDMMYMYSNNNGGITIQLFYFLFPYSFVGIGNIASYG